MNEVAAYQIPDKKTIIYVSGKDVFKSTLAFRKHLCDQWGFSETVATQHIESVASKRQVSEKDMSALLKARGMTASAIAKLLGVSAPPPRKKKNV